METNNINKKICHLGLYSGISPTGTGGAENLLRRIFDDDKTLYLLMDKDHNWFEYKKIGDTYSSASVSNWLLYLSRISTEYSINPVGLDKKNRLKFIFFSVLRGFHVSRILFNFPDNHFKRLFYFIEAVLFSNDLFLISDRQERFCRRIAKYFIVNRNISRICIPVPSFFFCSKKNKFRGDKIVVSFLGRLDKEKGVEEVSDLYELLCNDHRFDLRFYYIPAYNANYGLNLLNKLNSLPNVNVVYVDKYNSTESEIVASKALRETDIFLQPYHILQSAIDAPLLLYEAEYANCYIFSNAVDGIEEHLSGKHWLNYGSFRNFSKNAYNKLIELADRHEPKKLL